MTTATIDYYQREIAPCLPPVVLDFHTHTWNADNWKEKPWNTEKSGGRYMVTDAFYPPEQLLADGRAAFPDRAYEAVCFGWPSVARTDDGTLMAVVSGPRAEHICPWGRRRFITAPIMGEHGQAGESYKTRSLTIATPASSHSAGTGCW